MSSYKYKHGINNKRRKSGDNYFIQAVSIVT